MHVLLFQSRFCYRNFFALLYHFKKLIDSGKTGDINAATKIQGGKIKW
jgi:hypothetical protein